MKNNQKDIGCNGLLEGYARKQSDNTSINIKEVSKEDGELYCAEYLSKVNFRRCTDKIDHLYHVARQSNMDFTPESKLHLACKNELLSALQSIYPEGNWEEERHISNINSTPNLSGRINNKPLAIEIQKSSIKPSDIIKRTEKYASIGVPVLWIVLLYEPLVQKTIKYENVHKSSRIAKMTQEYFETLNRLVSNEPINIPIGSKINKDAVVLEAGRKRGSIKKSRKVFTELIEAIEKAGKHQNAPQKEVEQKLSKLRADK